MIKKSFLLFILLLNISCIHLKSDFDNLASSVWELCDESFKDEFLLFKNHFSKFYEERKTQYNDNYINILNRKDLPYNEHLSFDELCIVLCLYCDNTHSEQLYSLINKAFMQGVDGEDLWKPFLFYCWMANKKDLDKFNLLDSEYFRLYQKEWESNPAYLKGTEEIISFILRRYWQNNNAEH